MSGGRADILLLGSGAFAARIAFDLAAAARHPTRVVIAGRNAERLAWLRTAANARSVIFGSPARFETEIADLAQPEVPEEVLRRLRPGVVVQVASAQPGNVIAAEDAWARLVEEGGLSATAVFQATLSAGIARAVQDAWPSAHLVNCCFPDVVNPMLVALGLPVTCGTGNVGILANAFAGVAGERVRVLAHYQNLAIWRQPPGARHGAAPRVWLGDVEVGDVFGRFQEVQLTVVSALDISGAVGVPMMLAMAHGYEWAGHVPGPFGLPGGYPVQWDGGTLALDLPAGVSREDAVGWNGAFEAANGIVLEGTLVRYTGRLLAALRGCDADVAEGFDLRDLEAASRSMQALRTRLHAGAYMRA